MSDLRQQIERCARGRVCVMGLGNVDYGDDGFGVRLAEQLSAAGLGDVVIAGNRPERHIGRIAEHGFDHLIFLDAAEFGAEPGSVVFLNSGEMSARFPQVSTHKMSLGLLAALAESNGRLKAWLLGVQPESVKQCREMTPAMQQTLGVLKELLQTVVSQSGKMLHARRVA